MSLSFKKSYTYKSSSTFSYSYSSSSESTSHQSTKAYQRTISPSSSSSNTHKSVQTIQQATTSNPDGTTMYMRAQSLGEPVIQETRRFDKDGRLIPEDGRMLGWRDGEGVERRIEDVSDGDKVIEEKRR